ncbi:hypothetical protein JTB14_030525 [Gonioctena quinquepunctata]|nr:hypothetical protein JTB14_030525 [Gonioctena quinquepunctata]
MVHINDIDATIETEEVLEAILKLVGTGYRHQIAVRSLSPFQWGSSANCSYTGVRQRISLIRCQKCLEYEHHTIKCEGENRAQACRNCGGESHQRKALLSHSPMRRA